MQISEWSSIRNPKSAISNVDSGGPDAKNERSD